MNLLITGGAGYIGTELIFKLLNDSAVSSIVIYDNLNRGNYNFFLGKTKIDSSRLRFVKGDILVATNSSTLSKLGVGADNQIIHSVCQE